MAAKSLKKSSRLALISDVHGNLPALEAVLADAQVQGADLFWNLGDFLGYGPFANEVVDLLYKRCSAQVIGNYDLKVLNFPAKQEKWKKSKKPEKYLAFKWAWDNLSARNRNRLRKLPLTVTQVFLGRSFLLTHGSPVSVDDAIGPRTSDDKLRELTSLANTDYVVCGHTHQAYLRSIDETTFINPGSVGRPEGRNPDASYAILKSDDDVSVSFRSVPYDIARAKEAIHAAGLPDDFAKMLETGMNLDQVQEPSESKSVATETKIARARKFAQRCNDEFEHSEQVVKLAKILFQKLKPMCGLGTEDLFLLTCAAILHDIGWAYGQASHHKGSMQMILSDQSLELSEEERIMVALIARYHRKALPKSSHRVFRDLEPDQKERVKMLASILRIADGLDRSHRAIIKDVDVEASGSVVVFVCKTIGSAMSEMYAAQKKADLFEQVSRRKSRFQAHEIS